MPTPTILIVEDEKLIRKALFGKLTRNGFDVTEATDGVQAVALLQEKRFDLVLLDVFMPTMDGIAALRTLKEKGHKGSPIMLMTNLAEHDPKVQEARELGVVGVVIKADNGIGKLVEQAKEALAKHSPDAAAAIPK